MQQLSEVKQLAQLEFAIKAFYAFLSILRKSHPELKIDFLYKQCHLLLDKLKKEKKNPQELAKAINELITSLNKFKIAYPTFTFEGNKTQVMEHIIAFETFIHQLLEAKELKIDDELKIFDTCSKLFTNIEMRAIEPEDALARLREMIFQVNQHLEGEERYPLPELSAYE